MRPDDGHEPATLACVSCSLRKAARQSAGDPQSGQSVAFYNPRRDVWDEHFRWNAVHVKGITATGRATVKALKMNRPIMVAIRRRVDHDARAVRDAAGERLLRQTIGDSLLHDALQRTRPDDGHEPATLTGVNHLQL